jgi:hypothetical protein
MCGYIFIFSINEPFNNAQNHTLTASEKRNGRCCQGTSFVLKKIFYRNMELVAKADFGRVVSICER